MGAIFFHTVITVEAQDAEGHGVADECQKLLQRLMAEHPELETLRGKLLRTTIRPGQHGSIRLPGLEISPYTINIVEK
ncbi:hypothetical protein ACFTAO_20810 [Paenibacillus rhizoplanae]